MEEVIFNFSLKDLYKSPELAPPVIFVIDKISEELDVEAYRNYSKSSSSENVDVELCGRNCELKLAVMVVDVRKIESATVRWFCLRKIESATVRWFCLRKIESATVRWFCLRKIESEDGVDGENGLVSRRTEADGN
ncbi:unnamed protein product [Vicia faba]|uniref:Uncharacterized protein n=1 Tax=Vicia faba TaxID=3906 RepID=A0AAV1AH54_VICFA|nr:unnamed protein product [Vicia faba]